MNTEELYLHVLKHQKATVLFDFQTATARIEVGEGQQSVGAPLSDDLLQGWATVTHQNTTRNAVYMLLDFLRAMSGTEGSEASTAESFGYAMQTRIDTALQSEDPAAALAQIEASLDAGKAMIDAAQATLPQDPQNPS